MPRIKRLKNDKPLTSKVVRRELLMLKLQDRARKARKEALIITVLALALVALYSYKDRLIGDSVDTRIVVSLVLLGLSWFLARDIGRVFTPVFVKRLAPNTASVTIFLIRFGTLITLIYSTLRIAGLHPQTLLLGSAITAVIFGLAAQQTLGNLIAGVVLVVARPFRINDTVRLQGGDIAGQIEGEVTSFGLLYTVLKLGDDVMRIPNRSVLGAAIMPLVEPEGVDVLARLQPGFKPSLLQRHLDRLIDVPLQEKAKIHLEEVDHKEVVVRITAIPLRHEDGPILADEILEAVYEVTGSELNIPLTAQPTEELEAIKI